MNTLRHSDCLSPLMHLEIVLGDITLRRLAIIDQPILKFSLEAAAP